MVWGIFLSAALLTKAPTLPIAPVSRRVRIWACWPFSRVILAIVSVHRSPSLISSCTGSGAAVFLCRLRGRGKVCGGGAELDGGSGSSFGSGAGLRVVWGVGMMGVSLLSINSASRSESM
eukprot:10976951-Ditylum_brightwellii.AAC.1